MMRSRILPLVVLMGSGMVLAIAGCKKSAGPSNHAAPVAYTKIDPATAGTVSGTISFSGKAPERISIDMAQDPACGIATQQPNMTEQYVVRDGKMANVYVYIEDGLGHRVYLPSTTPVVMDQKGCQYVPHVIGVMAGQPVEFRNSDPTTHNVHVITPADGSFDGFDISQPPKVGMQRHVFRMPDLMIPVRCNNHPWMEAFINIASNPFFAVSDTDGHFEIHGLPPGNYTLAAVQEKLGTKTMPITVESEKTTEADFTFSK